MGSLRMAAIKISFAPLAWLALVSVYPFHLARGDDDADGRRNVQGAYDSYYDRDHDRDRDHDDRWWRRHHRRFAFLIEPSSTGTAGQSLAADSWLIALDKDDRPDFAPLDDIDVAAYVDSDCKIAAPGKLSVADYGLFARFGLAIFHHLSDTAAGQFYFRFHARDVHEACSRLVTIGPGVRDHLALVGGDGQSGSVGSKLPIDASVRVEDHSGQPGERR